MVANNILCSNDSGKVTELVRQDMHAAWDTRHPQDHAVSPSHAIGIERLPLQFSGSVKPVAAMLLHVKGYISSFRCVN